MTDKEIKQIEEVVKRSKYCNKFYKENNCDNRCPLRFKNEPYDLGFLDGFKAGYDDGYQEGFSEGHAGEDW